VGLDGVLADAESPRDHLVPQTGGDLVQHLRLAGGQALRLGPVYAAGARRGADWCEKRHQARCRRGHRRLDLLLRRRAVKHGARAAAKQPPRERRGNSRPFQYGHHRRSPGR
jgi:hypothetical protein